jgi:hypothetical protein
MRQFLLHCVYCPRVQLSRLIRENLMTRQIATVAFEGT